MARTIIKIGDSFRGIDCHKELVHGEVSAILKKTVIIENGTEHYVIKKTEFEKRGDSFPDYDEKKRFNVGL
ncbi:hypothetical protein ACQKTA_13370 (plasmid) [Enterococcus sp. 22-H-5-01]|uniref:hypothetical protein n=1 Tax=Enterococcus sp. 22-H-5-01 TaxID=3418555 RepID=UPI003D04BBF9